MNIKGLQITCDGCGKKIFLSSPKKIPINTSEHVMTTAYSEENTPWVRTDLKMDLCPTCDEIFRKTLCRFYEECGETRKNTKDI